MRAIAISFAGLALAIGSLDGFGRGRIGPVRQITGSPTDAVAIVSVASAPASRIATRIGAPLA